MSEAENAERHAFAFRIAIAASLGFTFGEVQGWHFPFLPALLAVQLLSGQRSFDLKKAVGFVVLMTAGCIFSLLIALVFIDRPLNFIIVMGIVIFLEFLALARGTAAAGIFLITTAFVPMMALTDLDLAYALVHNLIVGSILALLLTFLVHALFPSHDIVEPDDRKVAVESTPVRAALANTGVLMSLVIYFMGAGTPTSIIVIMVTAITILQQSAMAGRGAAFGLVIGNLAGGLAATVAYLLVSLLPAPAFLLLMVLLFGLIFGGKIAQGGSTAPIYAVSIATFLTVLGLGLSPLPGDSGSIFVSRILNVLIASLYTVGIASILRGLFLGPVRQ